MPREAWLVCGEHSDVSYYCTTEGVWGQAGEMAVLPECYKIHSASHTVPLVTLEQRDY